MTGEGEGVDEDEALLSLQSLLHPSATPATQAWQQARYTTAVCLPLLVTPLQTLLDAELRGLCFCPCIAASSVVIACVSGSMDVQLLPSFNLPSSKGQMHPHGDFLSAVNNHTSLCTQGTTDNAPALSHPCSIGGQRSSVAF